MAGRVYPHLDALRALAVLGPVVAHLWPPNLPGGATADQVTQLGSLGVVLFFVISGFLITGILLDARGAPGGFRHTLGAFFARRVLRIFPVYWLTLLAYSLLARPEERGYLPWEWAYLTNFLIADRQAWVGLGSHFWSLAVEEQFYLAWPFLILLVPRRALAPALALLVAGAPLFRWLCVADYSVYHASVLTPACLDSLGLGALLAVAWRRREAHPRAYRAFVVALGVLGTAGTVVYVALYLRSGTAWLVEWPLAHTSCAMLFAALVAKAAEGFRGAAKLVAELPPVVHLGTVSYAVYLFHPFMAKLPQLAPGIGAFAFRLPFAYFLVQVAATVALAAASWRFVERPINRLRNRFPYTV